MDFPSLGIMRALCCGNFLAAARVLRFEQIGAQPVMNLLQVDIQFCDLARGARLLRILLLNVCATGAQLGDLRLQLARRQLLLVERGCHFAQRLSRLVALGLGGSHQRLAARVLVAPVALPEVQARAQHRAQIRRAEAERRRAGVTQRGRVGPHVELDHAVLREHGVAEGAGELAGEGVVAARDAWAEQTGEKDRESRGVSALASPRRVLLSYGWRLQHARTNKKRDGIQRCRPRAARRFPRNRSGTAWREAGSLHSPGRAEAGAAVAPFVERQAFACACETLVVAGSPARLQQRRPHSSVSRFPRFRKNLNSKLKARIAELEK